MDFDYVLGEAKNQFLEFGADKATDFLPVVATGAYVSQL
jgi:hypothetical protein